MKGELIIDKIRNNESIFSEYPDVVTVEEVQKMLRIGRNKAYELIKNNKIKTIHNGRRYIIPKKSIIEFLDI